MCTQPIATPIVTQKPTRQEGKFKADMVPEGQNRMPIEIQVTDPMEKVLFR